MTVTVFVVGVIVEAVCIVFARRLARRKGRTPGSWGLAVLLVGPVALLVLLLMPAKQSDTPSSVTA